MSNLMDYIKHLRATGLSDYEILQMSRNRPADNPIENTNQAGGYGNGNGDDNDGPLNLPPPPVDLDPMEDHILDSGELPPPPAPITDAEYVDGQIMGRSKLESVGEYDPVDGPVHDADFVRSGELDRLRGDAIHPERDETVLPIYTKIDAGTIMYHPTSEIRTMSNDNMLFVRIDNVLDLSEQRSFTMFFTENKEYARRFAGIRSLNNRDVYVHTLEATEPITGLRIIDSRNLHKDDDVMKIATGFCGPSTNNVINGVVVRHPVKDGFINEYFICNPERFFRYVSSEMQFDSTTWVDVSPSMKSETDINSRKQRIDVQDFPGDRAEFEGDMVGVPGNFDDSD